MNRMNPEKSKKSNQMKFPIKSIWALAGVSLGAVIWVNIGSLTKYGLQIKLSESYIPTLINGITTSTSIIIGIFIAILGIMFRFSVEKKDSVSKQFYLIAMITLLVPIVFFWTTYTFLTQGLLTFAVTYALSTLIMALFICAFVIIYTVTRIANQTEKEDPAIGDDF